MIEFGHGTHAGLCRVCNEDTYYADALLGLFLVIDGMGGYQRGEVAAALARELVLDGVRRSLALAEAVRKVQTQLSGYLRGGIDSPPMGVTLAALRLHGDAYEVVCVGDSRVYGWLCGMERICFAPGWIPQGMEANLTMTAQQARPTKPCMMTQALGITSPGDLSLGTASGVLKRGMQFLLCSDGLTEELGDKVITELVGRTDLAAQECVDQLLLAALDVGGRDNITAILVRVD